MVFVHGTGGNKKSLDLLAEQLSQYSCYMIDLPGHGDSKKAEYSIESYLDAIEDFVSDMDNVIVIGHSMGAALTLGICERRLKTVKAGIILDGAAKFGNYKGIFDKLYKDGFSMEIITIMQETFGEMTNPEVVQSIQENLEIDKCAKDIFIDAEIDFRADLDKIDIPLLVMTGEDETLVPVSDSEFICEHVKNAKLSTIPNAMHLMPFTHKKEVASEISEFIESL